METRKKNEIKQILRYLVPLSETSKTNGYDRSLGIRSKMAGDMEQQLGRVKKKLINLKLLRSAGGD